VAALLSMTLKIGTRGHKGERDMREVSLTQHNTQQNNTALSTGNDINTEMIHRVDVVAPSSKQ
jgi:hypothetical protein